MQPYDADGQPMPQLRLARPLDFAAVTDHAELFGEPTICTTPACRATTRRLHDLPALAAAGVLSDEQPLDEQRGAACASASAARTARAASPPRARRGARCGTPPRRPTTAAAACTFTTFVGYEWTGGPGSNNIHRNVLFRNDAVPGLPISYFEEPQPQELWRALRRECPPADRRATR